MKKLVLFLVLISGRVYASSDGVEGYVKLPEGYNLNFVTPTQLIPVSPSSGCTANCTFTGNTTLASTVTINGADNTTSLLFPTVTYTSNMSSLPLISMIGVENTGAGTHDLFKIAWTKTGGNFNFINFLGGAGGVTPEFSVDSGGSVTANGTMVNAGTITGGGILGGGLSAPAYRLSGPLANQSALSLLGTSNTGTDATSPYTFTHTFNTSGVVTGVKYAFTDTAHGAGTRLFSILGGASATTEVFNTGTSGNIGIGAAFDSNSLINGSLSVGSQKPAIKVSNTNGSTAWSGLDQRPSGRKSYGVGIMASTNFDEWYIAQSTSNDGDPITAGVIRLYISPTGGIDITGAAPASLAAGTLNVKAEQNNGVATILNVASNFSTAANTNLQAITGLTALLPANTALNVPFTCKLAWSQATAAVVVSFGIQSDTVSPTNFFATGQMETNLTVTSYGDVTALTTTTATAVVTGTPAATATVYNAYIDGFLENPSNGSTTTLNIMVKTATAADVVTVYRGSFCRLF